MFLRRSGELDMQFAEIESQALEKHGREALEDRLSPVVSAADIEAIPADRFLSEATKVIFQAGFSWSLIEKKWPNFETAFEGFDVYRWSMMGEEDLDCLLKNEGIVRNAGKLLSVGKNALYFRDIIAEHGSVGAFFASWKPKDFFENLSAMQKRTNRLGAKTGQIFLRRMGVESVVLSNDVVKALIEAGVVAKAPTAKRDLASVQAALNDWREESGRSLSQISQILALSV